MGTNLVIKIVRRPGLKHANADVCLRHLLPTTVDNGARRDNDAGESDRTDAVVAWSAEVWQGYTTPVVVIARAARVEVGVAANPAAQQGGPPDIRRTSCVCSSWCLGTGQTVTVPHIHRRQQEGSTSAGREVKHRQEVA